MNIGLPTRFAVLRLILLFDSLLGRACLLFSDPGWHSPRPDFHVQLYDRFLTSDWESLFRPIHLALISKFPSPPLRLA